MEFLGVGVGQGTHRRTDRLGEMGQNLGVQRVGLGQPAVGFVEVAHLRGLITTTGRAAAAKAPANGSSNPPVDSSTTAEGCRDCNCDTRALTPAWS